MAAHRSAARALWRGLRALWRKKLGAPAAEARGTVLEARHWRWALGLTLVVYLFEYWGWLASPEGILLNFFLGAVRPFHAPEPTRITTLAIDDDAYKQCFVYSPMNPMGIGALVQAALDANPRAVGVDIITDSENREDLDGYTKLERCFRDKPVVWAADTKSSLEQGEPLTKWFVGGKPIAVHPTAVLGIDEPGDPLKWGMPIYPREEDLRLRRFPRTATVMPSGQARLNWAGQVAELYCRVPPAIVAPGREAKPDCSRSPKRDEVLISFAGPVSMPSFKMLELFDCKPVGRHESEVRRRGSDRWADFNDLAKQSIVLIGGTFASARDSYPTPIGPLDGLHFNAYAVQAELTGTGVSEVPPWLRSPLDVALGLGIAIIFDIRRKRRSKLNLRIKWCLGVLVGTVALGLVFYLFGYVWLSCVGIAVGMTIHVFIEIWKERLWLPPHKDHSGGASRRSTHGGA